MSLLTKYYTFVNDFTQQNDKEKYFKKEKINTKAFLLMLKVIYFRM